MNGKVRARKWPRTRGKPKTIEEAERQERFRQAQRIWNYIAPQIASDLIEATDSTALYPRDILTSILYNRFMSFLLPDGKVRYPVTSRNDVSSALDTITQTPGESLVRGEQGWEPLTQNPLQPIQLIAQDEITAPVDYWESPDLDEFSFVFAWVQGVTSSPSRYRMFQCWLDGESDYTTAPGEYRTVFSNGSTSSSTGFQLTTGSSAGALSAISLLIAPNQAMQPLCTTLNNGLGAYMPNFERKVHRVRLVGNAYPTTASQLTGGRITLLGM